jgi:hypothetical protein
MDNTAQEKDRVLKFSGVLFGSSSPGATDIVPCTGITIEIRGGSSPPRSTKSGGGGDFEFDSLLPGKYKLQFSDPSGKYYHSPFPLNIKSDIKDYPIEMTLSGEQENKHEKKGRGGLRWSLQGRVKDQKSKPLSGIEVSINGSGTARTLLRNITTAAARIITRKKREEKPGNVSIKITSNPLGFFFAPANLPDGRYTVACYDHKGKYKFISQTVVIKNKAYPFLSFTGYTTEAQEGKAPLTPEQIAEQAAFKQSVSEELEAYQKKSGKEVKLTEKVDRAAPEMTAEQAADKLSRISSETEKKPETSLVIPPEKPIKAARSGPRTIDETAPQDTEQQAKDEAGKNSDLHEFWEKAKEDERKLLAKLRAAEKKPREIPQHDLQDNPEAWRKNAPYTPTVWASPAGLQNMARAREANEDSTQNQQGEDSRKRRLAGRLPTFGRGSRGAAKVAKQAAQEEMSALNKATDIVKKNPVTKQILIAFLIVIGLVIAYMLLTGSGPSLPFGIGGGSSSGGTGPTGTGGTGGGGSIAACTFYRGNALPVSEQYKSTQLISYIEDASRVSGVPASVLAAVARVETPRLTSLTDETLSTYECPVSVDGAMGPMQIVVHYSSRTDAICRDCIAVGAQFLGKTVDELTQEDYCSLDSGFKIGAGFILKKMQYIYGGDGKWNPAWTSDQAAMYDLAESFYGCLEYGDPSGCGGPYNYGEDVWNSVSNCKPTSPGPIAGASCPIPNGTITCGSKANPINGCAHCDADYIRRYDPQNRACSYPQTHYAMDIGGSDLQEVILPTINGHQIKWVFTYEEYKTSNESIKGFAGEDTQNGDRFYLQLHHVDPGGFPGSEYSSGDVGAKICGNGCGQRHVHVELGTGGTSLGSVTWADATQFFCPAGV